MNKTWSIKLNLDYVEILVLHRLLDDEIRKSKFYNPGLINARSTLTKYVKAINKLDNKEVK